MSAGLGVPTRFGPDGSSGLASWGRRPPVWWSGEDELRNGASHRVVVAAGGTAMPFKEPQACRS